MKSIWIKKDSGIPLISRITILILFLAMTQSLFGQAIFRVDPTASGSGDGSTWADAYTDLQAAINAAAVSTPAQVWVKKGIYYPTTGVDRNVAFKMENDVEIYGGFIGTETLLKGRDWVANETILSGDIGTLEVDTDNTYNIVNNEFLPASPLTLSAVLDGFILEKGYADNTGGVVRNGGAAVRNNNASPTLRNNVFRSNYAPTFGGAVLNTGESNPFIHSCVFVDNSAVWGGGICYRAIDNAYANSNESIIANNLFYDNTAAQVGGAIYVSNYLVNIINNTITENASTNGGGGIFYNKITALPDASYVNNIIWGNTPTSAGQGQTQIRLNTPGVVLTSNIVEGTLSGGSAWDIDPLFTDAANNDFSIKDCNSPAINVGTAASLPAVIEADVSQNPREFDGAIDLGAYEYQYFPLSFSTVEVGNVSCHGGTEGYVSVNAVGGASPVEYNIDGGGFSASSVFNGLSVGDHTVIVMDANGCELSTTESVTEPAELVISVVATNVICNSNEDGTFAVEVSGGIGPYDLMLDASFLDQITGSYFIDEFDVGTFVFSATDANGCSVTAPAATLTEPDALIASLSVSQNVSCNGESNGELVVSASGGTAPYTYSLDGTNYQTSNVFGNLSAGTYTAHLRDANFAEFTSGCEVTTASKSITEPSVLTSVTSGTSLTCPGDLTGKIVVSGTDGTSPYEYSIDGTSYQSTGLFESLSGGSYDVICRDANGCVVSKLVVLSEPDAFDITSSLQHVSCNGEADGSISLVVLGGTSPYEYSIDGENFQSSTVFVELSAGQIPVSVRDDVGCLYVHETEITEPDELSISVTQSGQSFNATASGGVAPYEFSIDGSNFQSSGTFQDLGVGDYSFIVNDTNGCTTTSDQFMVVLGASEELTQVSIYPNPVSASLFVSGVEYEQLAIYNMDGRQVLMAPRMEHVNLEHLKSGLLLLFLYDEQGRAVYKSKIIKN